MRQSSFVRLALLVGLLCSCSAKKGADRERYAKICGASYPALNARGFKILSYVVRLSGTAPVELKTSAQHRAMCWAAHTDKAGGSPGSFRAVQRYALATLYFGTQPKKWLERTNWADPKKSVCDWYGVTCNVRGHVTAIDLGFNQLDGILVREIGLLTELQDLRLTANDFQGVIPNSIERLRNLKVLQLNMNGFFGILPKEIGNLKNLREFHMYGNYLQGKIPKEISGMTSLEILDLNANFFTGQLPTTIGKMSKLKEIFFNDNNLIGSVPNEICKLKRVESLVADCRGTRPEVKCTCCTVCRSEQMDPKCKETKPSKKSSSKK